MKLNYSAKIMGKDMDIIISILQWSPAISNFHRVKQKVRDSEIFEIEKFEIAGSHLEKFEIARFCKFYKLGSQTLTKANEKK